MFDIGLYANMEHINNIFLLNRKASSIYIEQNFQTAVRYFLIYPKIYDTFMATIYTQYGKINYTESVKKFHFHKV